MISASSCAGIWKKSKSPRSSRECRPIGKSRTVRRGRCVASAIGTGRGIIDGGLNVKPADFQIDRSDAKAAVAVARPHSPNSRSCRRDLSPVERRGVERKLSLALSLLRAPAIASRLPELAAREGELDQLCRRRAEFAESLAGSTNCKFACAPDRAHSQSQEEFAEQQIPKDAENGSRTMSRARSSGCMKGCHELPILSSTLSRTRQSRICTREAPQGDDLGEVYVASDTFLKQLNLLAARVAGSLASMATPVEEMISGSWASRIESRRRGPLATFVGTSAVRDERSATCYRSLRKMRIALGIFPPTSRSN